MAAPGSYHEREFSLNNEFYYADFGDTRLNDRLQQIGQMLGRAPGASIPNACADWACTKATYRFLRE